MAYVEDGEFRAIIQEFRDLFKQQDEKHDALDGKFNIFTKESEKFMKTTIEEHKTTLETDIAETMKGAGLESANNKE